MISSQEKLSVSPHHGHIMYSYRDVYLDVSIPDHLPLLKVKNHNNRTALRNFDQKSDDQNPPITTEHRGSREVMRNQSTLSRDEKVFKASLFTCQVAVFVLVSSCEYYDLRVRAHLHGKRMILALGSS